MSERPAFAIVCCGSGAEAAVKREVAPQGWRLAFSRPGLVTLKRESPPPAGSPKAADEQSLPQGVFVRTACRSLGMVHGPTVEENAAELRKRVEADWNDAAALPSGGPRFDSLHVWPRDRLPVGKFGYEPGIDEVSSAVGRRLAELIADWGWLSEAEVNQTAGAGDEVLDVVLVEPDRWAIGRHRVPDQAGRVPPRQIAAAWPGGVQPLETPQPLVSRAYFKAAEAIAWSGFEMRPGDTAVEVGSAPGGACDYLLRQGLRVIGIDPGEMDPAVADHPALSHIRARAGDLPRREFRGAKWLLVDSNVRPDQTLTTVEHIVTHREATIQGMLLTLKLGGFSHADRIDGWVSRVRGWGGREIGVRHLARGKIEVCMAARLRRAGP